VPWIEAETDRDLFTSLGLVHAHLRLAQIAILQRIAQGRLSEMGGPIARDIDHALRILDLDAAAPEIAANWPDETRVFVESFVAGVNAYQERAPAPPDFALLGIRKEPFTAEDMLALGRLASTDVNWLIFFGLLDARLRPDWQEAWRRSLVVAQGGTSDPALATTGGPAGRGLLARLLTGAAETGSNALVIGPERSANGATLLASDPHLGLNLPNLWLLAGMRSPSFEMVGMMIPGLPFVALGRNPELAWGGTNARALSSDLFDVAGEPRSELEFRRERVGTRFWRDREIEVRRHVRYGPVVSDSRYVPARDGEALALRWVGHEPSDEITAFLAANRATTPAAFRAAFASYAVSAQNLLFATGDGHIGKILAAWLPRRPEAFPGDLVRAANGAAWDGFDDVMDLPAELDPARGFIPSANERPDGANRSTGLFFSPDDRVARMSALVEANGKVAVRDLMAWQRDVTSPASAALAEALLVRIDAADLARGHANFLAPLRGWDGAYAVDARAPVVFETVLNRVALGLYAPDGDDARVPNPFGQWSQLKTYLPADLDRLATDARRALLAAALDQAQADAQPYPSWGGMHRERVGHILQNLPVLGRFFVLDERPVGGSRETLFKRAHDLVGGQHRASYGAQARFVADMSDPDANWFVLFGGQDGWLGSANFADQIPLWDAGSYIRMPLRPETVVAEFPQVTTLRPR
jgi:penicillin amidase